MWRDGDSLTHCLCRRVPGPTERRASWSHPESGPETSIRDMKGACSSYTQLSVRLLVTNKRYPSPLENARICPFSLYLTTENTAYLQGGGRRGGMVVPSPKTFSRYRGAHPPLLHCVLDTVISLIQRKKTDLERPTVWKLS